MKTQKGSFEVGNSCKTVKTEFWKAELRSAQVSLHKTDLRPILKLQSHSLKFTFMVTIDTVTPTTKPSQYMSIPTSKKSDQILHNLLLLTCPRPASQYLRKSSERSPADSSSRSHTPPSPHSRSPSSPANCFKTVSLTPSRPEISYLL